MLVSLTAACGASSGAAGTGATAVDDATGSDLAIAKDLGADAIAPDVAVNTDSSIPADVPVNPGDTASVDGPAKCPGAPGCTCKENGDCDNAQCIEIGSGKVCATPCVDKCDEGYKCTLINSGSGDSVTICVPKFVHLCDPCVKSKDCQTLGNSDAACVNEAGQGNFCGTACAADGDCAAGYGCQGVNSVDGAPVKQCVKNSGAPELKYGECTCSALAVATKAQTSCFIEHKNDKGELVGKCAGVRACGASGLTTCAAPALDVEVCDGKDNDCDGLTDENTCDAGGACNVGTCDPQAGCQYNKLNNVPCDADKNACTENDQCKQGACVPGPGKVCDDGNPCTSDACDPASGCTKTVDDGKLCDADGNACTVADHCVGATCTPGKDVVCDNSNICSKASCDSGSGKCVGKSVQDGVPCDDKTVCTGSDVCKGGECLGKIISCDDTNPCTSDSCDAVKGCVSTNLEGNGCDDDNPCTVGDLCKEGACVKGALKACDSGMACTVGACSLTTGKCDYKNKIAGAPCNDGDACSENDGCADAVCQGKSVNCDDANPCTNDTCDNKAGCKHVANISPCSDGDACTLSDNCAAGTCVSGAAKICVDNLLCTADTCNKTTGNCVFDGAAMNGTPCDDSNVCTLGDNCLGGFCAVGIQKDCNDNNLCTDDLCDKVKGCSPTFNSKACDDSNACTGSDICKFGDCEGNVIKCDDGNLCTDDACDPKKGCIVSNNAVICDDNSKCTSGDACKNGKCGGAVVNCDDNNVCSDDSCDNAAGCLHDPNLALCPDSDACTTAEKCAGMNCVKKAVVCDDLNPCTLDTCDAVKGCQVNNVVDGIDCGGGFKCNAGKCISPCQPGSQVVAYSGAQVDFNVPACVKSLTIEAWGAQGGKNVQCVYVGGKGAYVKGTFVTAGSEVLHVVVGGLGKNYDLGNTSNGGSSGGGGSFIWKGNDPQPWLVAGGGGGAAICTSGGNDANSPGIGGVVGPDGTKDLGNYNAGGTNGSDGTGQGAGRGWNTVKTTPAGVGGGLTQGGFGGGGEVSGTHSGGGGGGYSGGGAHPYVGPFAVGGGGAGSYNAGANTTATGNTQSGNGQVKFSW